jgi:hypothetical protein
MCLIIHGFGIPDKGITDLEQHRLKGSVKSVMEIKYTLAEKTANSPKDKIIFQKFTSYDKSGYRVESILFKESAQFLKSSIMFGPDGRPSGLNEFTVDGTPNLNVIYKYNEKGYISEADYQWADDYITGDFCENTDYYNEIIKNDLFVKVMYTSEYRGYITEEKFIKADGSISFSLVSRYDPLGNRSELSYFHGDGHLSWITKYKYDRYNNLIESRLYKSNRIAVLTKYKHQFDAMGNWTVRSEEREIYVNILTAGLERADMVTERNIEYY